MARARAVAVARHERAEPRGRLDLEARLLEQLAAQRVERVLALPEEAAREVPHPRIGLPRPSGQQDSALVVDAERARRRRGVRVRDVAAGRALGEFVRRGSTSAPQRGQ